MEWGGGIENNRGEREWGDSTKFQACDDGTVCTVRFHSVNADDRGCRVSFSTTSDPDPLDLRDAQSTSTDRTTYKSFFKAEP